ncbi:amidophosphoribosyltransferase [Xanthomonas arboricola pv. juglandis]|uniref:ComF family protein n=1 Tax=Xanthomonas TaxID=338 RepID=UPI000E824B5E|nr:MULTISPECIES: ComF family protein [Xanthomonas]CAG2083564.1 ComF family protein [Xanthomonas euroxanthea]SYZ55511.1 amidophosphoribosyltransferase [Xanthomonas arboricola pv. juglandis]
MREAVNFDEVHSVYSWPRRVLRLLLPNVCLVCAEAGTADGDLCPWCRAALPAHGRACLCCATPLSASDEALLCGQCLQHRPPLQHVHACFTYHWPVDGLLRRFKFRQDLAAGRLLSELMVKACAGLPRPQALVPVSLHRQRLRQRGYDQALELARPLGRALRLPCLPLLRRVRATAPQSELDAAERQRNLRGAFVAGGALPAHVALVDDVMTTGATLHAAAQALHRAGVQRVDAWVCARVP